MLFLYLGALLYQYAFLNDIDVSPDLLFVNVISQGELGISVFILFLLGLISAAYSSADSALTSLTTSFCVDFLGMAKKDISFGIFSTRSIVHLFMSILLFIIIMLIKYLNNDSIISTLFLLASYTYGPLLGLFGFGLFTKRQIYDKYLPVFIIIPPIVSFFIASYDTVILNGFDFGPDLLIINGLITFILLFLISKK